MSLWTHRDFLRLWIGQSASQLATFAAQVSLPLVAVSALGIGAAFGVPFLYVVAFAAGVCTVCFDVSYQASLPRLVARDQLAEGNSMLETTRSAAQITGPALGGGLVSLLSAPIAVVASAVLYVCSALSIARIRSQPPAGPTATGMVRQIRDGLRVVVRHATLRPIAAATCAYQFSFTALTTVYLLFLTRTLDLPSAVVGLVLASFGPGVLIGSLFSAYLPRRFGYRSVVVYAALSSDVVMLITSTLHCSTVTTVAALIVINIVYGALSQSVDVAVTALRQLSTPLPFQGRVATTINFLGLGLTPLGALLGGALAGSVGVRTALLVATAGRFLSPLCLTRLRPSFEPAEEQR